MFISIYLLFLPPLILILGFNWNMSWCLESLAVLSPNLLQICCLRSSSRSKPNSRSCAECDRSQRPVIAAMATLWALSRDRDWATVRLECQTGQAYSSITLPSLCQYCTRRDCLTPRLFILLIIQVQFVALLIISVHCKSHLSELCTMTPRILSSDFSSRILESPIVNSAGKSYFLDLENFITKHFFLLINSLFVCVKL